MPATRISALSRLSCTVPHFCGRAFAGLGALWHQFAPSRQRCASRNQPRAALVGDVRPCPLDEHDEAVTEANQKQNVYQKPPPPRPATRKADLSEFADRG